MSAFEIRHPKSGEPLQGVRHVKAGEYLEDTDWESLQNGTWQKCPPERIGSRVDQRELDRGVVYARPISGSTLSLHLAIAQAGMGSMRRLSW